MSKPKPKSPAKGVYYRDDGQPRWEVKVRWVEDGEVRSLPTVRFPVDRKAPRKHPFNIEVASSNAVAYAAKERQKIATYGKPASMLGEAWTFRALLEKYLVDLEDGLIKHKSLNTTRSAIRLMLGGAKGHNSEGFPKIADKWVKDLSFESFVGGENSLQALMKDRDGNQAGDSALKRALTTYRGVFNRAQKVWKIDLNNPLETISGLGEGKPRERTVSADEWVEITQELSGHEQGTQDAIHFARWTAARRAEVVKLDWTDINFASRVARLRDTKSKADKKVERTIPVPQEAWDILMRRAQPPNAKRVLSDKEVMRQHLTGPVFTNDKGRRVRADTITQAWSRACARAGVAGARIHDLRHTRITELGRFMTAAEVARVSGHTDLATFFRYFNPDPAETRQKIDSVEQGEKGTEGVKGVANALAGLNTEEFGTAITLAIQIKEARKSAGK